MEEKLIMEERIDDHDYALEHVHQKDKKDSFNVCSNAWFYILLSKYADRRKLRDRLTLKDFFIAVVIGNLILACYTGALAYIADTGLSMHLLLDILWRKGIICSIIYN